MEEVRYVVRIGGVIRDSREGAVAVRFGGIVVCKQQAGCKYRTVAGSCE